MNSVPYTEDYYERGVELGISGYSHYRWIPELTVPLAMTYIDKLGITREHKVLDFGSAKGFTVKALRLLYRQAWGCDISSYAINSADNDTRKFLNIATEGDTVPFDFTFDFIISKDIFEHIPEDSIDTVLSDLRGYGKKLFAIVPLGDENGKFVIPAYELDKTHVLIKDKDWWIKTFEKNGWVIDEFSYCVKGIKDSWSNFKDGNGIFLLS